MTYLSIGNISNLLAVTFVTIIALMVLFKIVQTSDDVEDTVRRIEKTLRVIFLIMCGVIAIVLCTVIECKFIYK